MTAPPPGSAARLCEPGLVRLLAALREGGEEARIVGGAVRNMLMGLPVSDIDIATTLPPLETISRAVAAGLHAVPTGIEHGTVTVVAEGRPYEVTTLREDIETDGRRAKVRFGRDFRQDALRRDFTMNALSILPDGSIYDPVGGLADLQARRVRFIGDPARRIAEDHLRSLRFLRFSAAYGAGALDPDGFRAVIAARDGLDRLSRERIRSEIMKLLVAPAAVPVVSAAAEAGLIERVLAGVPLPARFARHVALEGRDEVPADAVARLVALGVFVSDDVDRLRERLRLSNDERDDALALFCAATAATAQAAGETALRRFVHAHGMHATRGIRLAEAMAPEEGAAALAPLRELARAWRPPPLLLGGRDIVAAGVSRGPAVGRVLAALVRLWGEAGFPGEEPAQRRLLQQALADAHLPDDEPVAKAAD